MAKSKIKKLVITDELKLEMGPTDGLDICIECGQAIAKEKNVYKFVVLPQQIRKVTYCEKCTPFVGAIVNQDEGDQNYIEIILKGLASDGAK